MKYRIYKSKAGNWCLAGKTLNMPWIMNFPEWIMAVRYMNYEITHYDTANG